MPTSSYINIPIEVSAEMLDVNVYHYFMFHKLFLDLLLERSKRGKKSLLLGTASVVSYRSTVPFVVYSASKGASGYLSRALHYELGSIGKQSDGSDTSLIDVSCATPFGTATNLVTGEYKYHLWNYVCSKTTQYCDALERDLG